MVGLLDVQDYAAYTMMKGLQSPQVPIITTLIVHSAIKQIIKILIDETN